MKLPLTDEDVNKAISLDGYVHPVIDLLDKNSSLIIKIDKAKGEDSKRQDYIASQLGDFADSVESVGEFTLNPLEIIAIWSKLNQYSDSNYIGYAMSRIVSVAYGIQPLDKKWKSATRLWLQHHKYPESALDAKEDVKIYASRLDEISRSLSKITHYKNGHTLSMSDIFNGIKTNDNEIMKIYEKTVEREKLPQMRLLGILNENFANGFRPIYILLERDSS